MIRAVRAVLLRIAAVLRRDHHDREFGAELDTHLEMSIHDYRRRGLSPAEARRAALIALGGARPTQDLHRDTRGLPGLELLILDVRYALRSMARARGFTIAAVLILALGIGANTLVFSIVNTVLLRPLPFAQPERLVWVANQSDASTTAGLSGVSSLVVMLQEWQRRATSFEALTGYNAFFGYGSYKLAASGEPERLVGVEVARNFFDTLGVTLHAGRPFTEDEARPNGPRAAILSYDLWQRRFAGDAAILGRQVTLNDRPATVVGVLPASFDFGAVFAPGVRVDVMQPLVLDVARNWGNTLAIIGRLRPGVSVEQGGSELAGLVPGILQTYPQWGTAHGARVTTLDNHVRGGSRQALTTLAGAVALVLLIVCADLSNLLLSRGAARQREFGIRAALGAGRGRLVRQLLTETLLLAGIGAALGFAAASAGTRVIGSVPHLSVPLLTDVQLDARAALFTVVIATLAAVLAGLFPALQLSRGDVQHAMKEGAWGSSGSGGRLRAALVVAEVALACVLLIGAGLLLRSFDRLLALDLGFRPDQAVTVRIEAAQTIGDAAVRREFAAEAVRRASGIPGVTAAGLTDTLPLDRNRSWGVRVPGRTFSDEEAPVAHVRMVGSGYLAAMGIRLHAGRDFSEREGLHGAELLLVNRTMARTLWPGRDALGEQVIVADRPARIIGVVDDVRHSGLEQQSGFEMYLPIGRFTIRSADLVVRASLPPEQLTASLRTALRPLDPAMPLADVRPLRTLVDRAVSPRRLYTMLVAGFAGSALVLACLGIFGVISYGVTRRIREIGIRLALGATPSRLRREVVLDTLKLAGLGVAAGAAAAVVLSRALASLLFGITPTDPLTYAVTAAVLMVVSLLAAYLPARRAARVDPLIALRGD